MITWYTIKNGKVDNIAQSNDKIPPLYGSGWIKAPDNWKGVKGDKTEWIDKNTGHIIPEQSRVRIGLQIDDRGIWFDKTTREQKHINIMDGKANENWTRVSPIANETCQKWDEEKKQWVIDASKKERAEKEKRLEELIAQVEDAEKRIIRPLRAIQKNRATEADLKWFDDLDTFIESLRPEITQLEEELKK